MQLPDRLGIAALRAAYRERRLDPLQLVDQLHARMAGEDRHHVWIRRLGAAELRAYARPLLGRDPDSLPLYGIPFAIKDNIDLAGIPTTAGCPEFAYTPERSAFVVERLIAAGAIPVGKTNLDQFATGLVGARSPYGAARNALDPEYISGGSSSGSALAVALGLASFSLGTDTAGSGRVPAAFNDLVGLKPSGGLLSTRGVVPACRTLDCVSIFARDAGDAAVVFDVAAGYDPEDAYSRRPALELSPLDTRFRFGVPREEQLEFFGNPDTPALFRAAIARLERCGGSAVRIDFAPFLETARLLYEGPWIAERYAAIRDFIEQRPDALLPITAQIIGAGARYSAVDAFTAAYRLKALQRRCETVWNDIDVLLTPTAGTVYSLREVAADPIRCNSNLGYYTNFMNLLDLSAIAVPGGFQQNGLPFGVTLAAPAFGDRRLLALAARLQAP